MATMRIENEIKRMGPALTKTCIYLCGRPDKFVAQRIITKKTKGSTGAFVKLVHVGLITPHKANRLQKHSNRFKMSMDQVHDFLFGSWLSPINERHYFDELHSLRNYVRELQKPTLVDADMSVSTDNVEDKADIVLNTDDIPIMRAEHVEDEPHTTPQDVLKAYLKAANDFNNVFGVDPTEISETVWGLLEKVSKNE